MPSYSLLVLQNLANAQLKCPGRTKTDVQKPVRSTSGRDERASHRVAKFELSSLSFAISVRVHDDTDKFRHHCKGTKMKSQRSILGLLCFTGALVESGRQAAVNGEHKFHVNFDLEEISDYF